MAYDVIVCAYNVILYNEFIYLLGLCSVPLWYCVLCTIWWILEATKQGSVKNMIAFGDRTQIGRFVDRNAIKPIIITIPWAFCSSYSSWKLFTYKAWPAAWSVSKLIVEWCMHENVSCLNYGIHLQQTYCLLLDIHGGSLQGDEHIKDIFLKNR